MQSIKPTLSYTRRHDSCSSTVEVAQSLLGYKLDIGLFMAAVPQMCDYTIILISCTCTRYLICNTWRTTSMAPMTSY